MKDKLKRQPISEEEAKLLAEIARLEAEVKELIIELGFDYPEN